MPRSCAGVASTFLADRIRPGQAVRVFVHPSHKFGLPESNKPIIMVGPGTGIAPFRSFLQERSATKSEGKSWLIFGDQKASCDFLFQEELKGYLQTGVLTRLDTAFSRDQHVRPRSPHHLPASRPDDHRSAQLPPTRPPAAATTAVLVGLPFTTKVLERPARAFASPSPTRSRFSSNASPFFSTPTA